MGTLLELTKFRITLVVTFTTATGYFLGPNAGLDMSLLLALLGTLLLAAGSAAINQVQDAKLDAKMARTKGRPIPSGRMDRATALFVAGLLSLTGMVLLASLPEQGNLAVGLGVLALVWYNAIYTPLKRVTAFAVVPGSVIGAIPPVIGFVAAGGQPTDPYILLVAAFFFIWQIPHFWLLLLMFGEQYAEAGQPSLTTLFSRRQLVRLTAVWLLASATAGMAVAVAELGPLSAIPKVLIVAASLWLGQYPLQLLLTPDRLPAKLFGRAFMRINAYAVAVMVCLSLSAVI